MEESAIKQALDEATDVQIEAECAKRGIELADEFEPSLGSFSDHQIKQEFESRDLSLAAGDEFLESARNLLRMNRADEALALLRSHVEEMFGCVL